MVCGPTARRAAAEGKKHVGTLVGAITWVFLEKRGSQTVGSPSSKSIVFKVVSKSFVFQGKNMLVFARQA